MSELHVNVFAMTYTADVSGVCSTMYELGGMTVLHDPSGCNSTYTTHDEPRWYNTKSLMYISGLDEMTAIMGDDSVLVRDVKKAAEDLSPRFITLCGSAIPHLIAFDYKGTAHLIEKATGIPVIPVATDGLKLYTSGIGLALREWMKRFADFSLPHEKDTVNLLGVTPIDFSRMEIVEEMKKALEERGFTVNCCAAMGDSFEKLQEICKASVNLVVSSAGMQPAKMLSAKAGIPFVVGTPIGAAFTDQVAQCLREAQADGKSRYAYDASRFQEKEEGEVLVVGEKCASCSLAQAVDGALGREAAFVLSPDVRDGLDEDALVEKMKKADIVIGDPLLRYGIRDPHTKFIALPHEGYSGRIYRKQIPVFTGDAFDVVTFLEGGRPGGSA